MYDIEVVKYWPQWMSCYSSPASGSLLNQFFIEGGIVDYARIYNQIYAYGNRYNFYSQAREEWIVESPKLVTDSITISFHTSSTSGIVSRAHTLYDYQQSLTPTFYIDNGIIRFTNLDVVAFSAAPNANYQITLPPVVADSEIWVLERYWERHTTNPITVPTLTTRSIYYHDYNLNTELATGTVIINGGPPVNLTKIDKKNWLDDQAQLFNTKRFNSETNTALANRLKYGNFVRKTNKLKRRISVDSDTITAISWATSGVLNLQALGYTNITDIYIEYIPEYKVKTEIPYKTGYNTYRLDGIPEQDSLYVFSNNLTIPATSSANVVTTLRDTTSISAIYQSKVYEITRTNGYITSVSAVSGNLAETVTTVYLLKGIDTNTLNSTFWDNLPNQSKLSIATYIRERVPTTLGFGTWQNVRWLIEDVAQPQLTFIFEDLE